MGILCLYDVFLVPHFCDVVSFRELRQCLYVTAGGRQSGTQRTAHTLSLLSGLGRDATRLFSFIYLSVGL